MELTFNSALNDIAETVNELKGNFLSVSFYARPSRAGSWLRFGVGWGLWNEYTFDIPFSAASITGLKPVIVDLSSLNITRINKAGFQILDNDPGSLLIDRMTFNIKNKRHLTLENVKQIYLFSPDEISIQLECGPVPRRLEDYINNLLIQNKVLI